MKETRLNKIINNVNTDLPMDQRITDQLVDYGINKEAKHNIFKTAASNLLYYKIKHKYAYQIFLKSAAAIVLLLLGTSTVYAAGFILKSHPVEMRVQTAAEYEAECAVDRSTRLKMNPDKVTTQKFGEAITIPEVEEIMDADGNVIEYRQVDKISAIDPVKSGDDVFRQLGHPNLIPTYLLDDYVLGVEGYLYKETDYSGRIVKTIEAVFYSDESSNNKNVHVMYLPIEDIEYIDSTIHIVDSDLSYEESKYETESGLTFNILAYQNDYISAEAYFELDTLGGGAINLSFNNITMDEVKMVLDSIPVVTK